MKKVKVWHNFANILRSIKWNIYYWRLINNWFAWIVCVPCVPAQVCVNTWTQQKYTKDPCMITTNQSRQTLLHSFLWLCKSLVYLMHKSLSVSLSHSWVLRIIWSLADIYPMVRHCDNIHKLFPYYWNWKIKLHEIICIILTRKHLMPIIVSIR